VFRKAGLTVYRSALGGLERDFALLMTICTDDLCHFPGPKGSWATKTSIFHCFYLLQGVNLHIYIGAHSIRGCVNIRGVFRGNYPGQDWIRWFRKKRRKSSSFSPHTSLQTHLSHACADTLGPPRVKRRWKCAWRSEPGSPLALRWRRSRPYSQDFSVRIRNDHPHGPGDSRIRAPGKSEKIEVRSEPGRPVLRKAVLTVNRSPLGRLERDFALFAAI